jgi:hypothetical protein
MIEQVKPKAEMGGRKITIYVDNNRQINQNINTALIRTKTNYLVIISLLFYLFYLEITNIITIIKNSLK